MYDHNVDVGANASDSLNSAGFTSREQDWFQVGERGEFEDVSMMLYRASVRAANRGKATVLLLLLAAMLATLAL